MSGSDTRDVNSGDRTIPSEPPSVGRGVQLIGARVDLGMPLTSTSPVVGSQHFRIVVHLNHGVRLVLDVAGADVPSVRRCATVLLRIASVGGLPAAGGLCWCEVWAADETGEFLDSAQVDETTGGIEWESDPDSGTRP